MKVILSRKGMDSAAGGIASPILPDNTLLSLPIPDSASEKAYCNLYYEDKSFQDIIKQISPRFNFEKKATCHLDPDIYNEIDGRCEIFDWKPAFGQQGIAGQHLDKEEVDVGDIFLFYGMFRKTEYQENQTLRYIKEEPIKHIIYGYMKVKEILRDEQEIVRRYPWHPHSKHNNYKSNRLYIPAECGVFSYNDSLVLTKKNQSNRRLWTLPAFMAEEDIHISWQGKGSRNLQGEYCELLSSCRGQEFVISAPHNTESEQRLSKWVNELIQKNKQSTYIQ